MARFCENCGRPLADGEVCNCTGTQGAPYTQPNYTQPNYTQPNYTQPNYTQPYGQPNYTQPAAQPAQTSAFVNQAKSAIQELLPILKQPFTKTQELASSGNQNVGIAGIVAKMAANILLLVVIWNKLISYIVDQSYFFEKEELVDGLKDFGISLPKLIIFAIILTVGYDVLKALLLKAFTQNVFKGETNLSEMLTVVGAQDVFSAVALLAALLISLVSPLWGIGLYFLASSAIAVIEPVCYAGVARLDGNKKLFTYMIVSVIMVVAVVIVYRLGFAELMSNYASLLDELF